VSVDLIEKFIRLLKHSPSGPVFNPWWQPDPENDIGPQAPAIRRTQLRAYLGVRVGKARLVVIGEALGYRGGHFSGIPMTSERILLGKKADAGIDPKNFFSKIKPRRTSRPDKYPEGFSEPTATIVWSRLLRHGFRPEEFVLWNAFPWHSFDPRAGILSNRTPTWAEQSAGLPVLKAFLNLFSGEKVVALGKIATSQLEQLAIPAQSVRHPASGGAKLFGKQIARIVSNSA
jgi:uracil-DNA glycosylase